MRGKCIAARGIVEGQTSPSSHMVVSALYELEGDFLCCWGHQEVEAKKRQKPARVCMWVARAWLLGSIFSSQAKPPVNQENHCRCFPWALIRSSSSLGSR